MAVAKRMRAGTVTINGGGNGMDARSRVEASGVGMEGEHGIASSWCSTSSGRPESGSRGYAGELVGLGWYFEDATVGRQFRTIGRTVTEPTSSAVSCTR
jgi:hypothetical protein